MLIAQPIGIGPEAVDEVKTSLRIENGDEDALAGGLIGSAASLCEQFIGRALLRRGFTEVLSASSAWTRLQACPVHAIVGLDAVGADGAATPIMADGYAVDIDAAGEGWVRMTGTIEGRRVQVRYQAGLASAWTELPEALRHGIVRLAAHLYQERDRPGETAPPAAVTALWRPWRRLRLG